MQCFNCHISLTEKKFSHPFLEEWLCINCFEKRVDANHILIPSKLTFPIIEEKNFSEAAVKDDLNLSFVFCTVGANSNKDGFDEEGLISDFASAQWQRLDWEHTAETIGVITNSEFIKQDNMDRIKELGLNISKSFIYIKGILWKIMNKARAKEVITRYTKGSLYCSMEDFFDYVICSVCGGKFVYDNEYCDHLKNRFSTAANGAYRILRGSKFCGAGVVTNPADRNAIGLSVAKDLTRYKIISQLVDPEILDYYSYMKKRERV